MSLTEDRRPGARPDGPVRPPLDLRRTPARPDLTVTHGSIEAAARSATDRAREHLLGLQQADGHWKALLQTNVTMDAEDLLMRHFLGILDPVDTEHTARWIRSQQQPDGGWNTFHGGPSELSTTVEAWAALRLAGDAEDSPHLRAAAAYVQAHGGLERTRVFTRIWFALFGEWSWDDLPVIPPEVVFLPTGAPLALADLGCWARQTVVPLTIVATLRPVRSLPFSMDPMRTGAGPSPFAPWNTWAGAFERLDVLLKRYQKHPLRRLRERALDAAERWILARQEADGSWGGIQPPWVYSILALHLRGRSLDDPVLAKALAGLDRFTVRAQTPDGPIRWLEACQSPVWDTALAMIALGDSGVAPDHPALQAATRWMLAEEVDVPGDWRSRRPTLAPGGWAFEYDNDLYPDVDDTAEVVLALQSQGVARAAVRRGVDWMLGMQCKGGGWAAFDADQTRTLPTTLPFCDFGAVIDPPTADVTAHVIEALAREGLADSEPARRGIAWLLGQQERTGSWYGRWGVNHLYGTGAAVPALVEAGVPRTAPSIRKAVGWLLAVQQEDGGWGEDIRSYADPAWIGRGTATASQTAWALLALLAADEGTDPELSAAIDRGVRWLVRTQRPDGTWDEPQFTGTGFPTDFSLNYHLYRLVFPLTALGRYVRSLHGGGSAPSVPGQRGDGRGSAS